MGRKTDAALKICGKGRLPYNCVAKMPSVASADILMENAAWDLEILDCGELDSANGSIEHPFPVLRVKNIYILPGVPEVGRPSLVD